MNKKPFMATLLAAGIFSACSSSDVQAPADPTRHISVEVNQRPLKPDGTDDAGSRSTRADITTTETFGNFSLRAIYDGTTTDYTASKAGEAWTVSPASWPTGPSGSASVPFYAYTGSASFQVNSGNPYISFTTAENASTQHDLLVATNDVAYNDHQGKVPLTFDHACAALLFSVKMTNTLQTQLAGTPLTVNSIVLRNVSSKGKYYFRTSTWDEVGTPTYYTLNNSDITVSTEAQTLSSGYLFLVSQTRAANGTEGTYLQVTYTFSGQTRSSAVIPLDVNWQAGTEYSIDIRLGTTLIQ